MIEFFDEREFHVYVMNSMTKENEPITYKDRIIIITFGNFFF
jgi:hypothetical protein